MMLAEGAPVALGADGAASNDNQNMWEVLKLTAMLHNLYGSPKTLVTAEQALRLCWRGGAQLLRQSLGAIRPGCQADSQRVSEVQAGECTWTRRMVQLLRPAI
jgi:5-methylthioadenosine/S-adenosylhomocysteine deaminase